MSPPNDSTSPTGLRAGCLRWLYVDFNSYFASVEQQLNPALRSRPVIVIPVESDSTCAIAASYEAKAYGIRTGTAVYEAKKMCPGLICVMGKHDMYRKFHDTLLEEIERHIHIDDVCSIDEVACRLMNNETAPAYIAALAQKIKHGIAENVGAHIRCSIGVAPNRYLAKVATDLQKPDGFTILPAEDLPHRLFGLSLRDLPGIGTNMEQRLRRHGITTVEQVFNYAPKHLRAVWGSIWGEKMWYLLRGIELPEEKGGRRSVGHSHVLAPALRPPAQAYQVAKRLTVKCAGRLRRMAYHATRISLSVRIENGPRLGADLAVEAADDNFTFLGRLEALWEALLQHAGQKRIKKVSVSLSGLIENGRLHHQGDLFAAQVSPAAQKTRQRHGKISEAMDALNKKFGKDTVSLGMLPEAGRSFSGTKIAFTRIPDMEEFLE